MINFQWSLEWISSLDTLYWWLYCYYIQMFLSAHYSGDRGPCAKAQARWAMEESVWSYFYLSQFHTRSNRLIVALGGCKETGSNVHKFSPYYCHLVALFVRQRLLIKNLRVFWTFRWWQKYKLGLTSFQLLPTFHHHMNGVILVAEYRFKIGNLCDFLNYYRLSVSVIIIQTFFEDHQCRVILTG